MIKTKRLVTAITLSAFLIAISVIVQRFLVIPFGMPSLYRLSLGNLPIIMASLYLGPIFGAIVGAASDLLGATLFPVGTLIIWPVISSTLYGVVPWLFLKVVVYLDKKIKIPFFYVFLAIIFIVLELYIFINPSVRHPFNNNADPIMFTIPFRVIFTIVLTAIISGLIAIFYYLRKKYPKGPYEKYTGAPTSLAFTLMLMTFFVDILYSSWWKMFQFKVDFFVSVFFHSLILFILLPFQVTLLIILSNVYAQSPIAALLSPLKEEEPPTDE
ncbi:MAG: Folate transporter FolT [Tenericutes bacterium ADurb.Bin239]|nr:MAG: Folate transporter FolT [Tenericutes bacterium ADurb.Bin239]